MLADVGLTWRVTPCVREERDNSTAVMTRVNNAWWEAIMWKLLMEIGGKLVISIHHYILTYSTSAILIKGSWGYRFRK